MLLLHTYQYRFHNYSQCNHCYRYTSFSDLHRYWHLYNLLLQHQCTADWHKYLAAADSWRVETITKPDNYAFRCSFAILNIKKIGLQCANYNCSWWEVQYRCIKRLVLIFTFYLQKLEQKENLLIQILFQKAFVHFCG